MNGFDVGNCKKYSSSGSGSCEGCYSYVVADSAMMVVKMFFSQMLAMEVYIVVVVTQQRDKQKFGKELACGA